MTNQIENDYVYSKPFIYKCDQCKHPFEPIDKSHFIENPEDDSFHKFSCPNCGWRYCMRVQKDEKELFRVRRDEAVESDDNWLSVTINAVTWPMLFIALLYMLKVIINPF